MEKLCDCYRDDRVNCEKHTEKKAGTEIELGELAPDETLRANIQGVIQEAIRTDDSVWGAQAAVDLVEEYLRERLGRAPKIFGQVPAWTDGEDGECRAPDFIRYSSFDSPAKGASHEARLAGIRKLGGA